ncbi:MAG: hypothetical protein IJ859_06160 [Synergistaceae bacterium]|nr:hypothetical protein [Synergistaceae bacterium]
MYFLWKNTPRGFIKISYEGLFDFVNYVLRTGFRLYSITLAPASQEAKASHADLTVVISDEDISPDIKEKVEKHLSEVLDPTGMKAAVVWATPERGFMQIIQNPYVWAAIASCSAVIITAGFTGFFWTAFWGASAWFAIRGLSMLAKKIRSA